MREIWINDVDLLTQKQAHRNSSTDCHMGRKAIDRRKAAFPTDSKGAIRDLYPLLQQTAQIPKASHLKSYI